MSESGQITALLSRIKTGDRGAFDRLVQEMQPDLRRIAQAQFRGEGPGHLLQPTALVNEVWQKFLTARSVELKDRVHFLSLCSRLMRRILVDHARHRAVQQRALLLARPDGTAAASVLDLELALARLEEIQPRAAKVVELRYFGGLTNEEIAATLDVSPRTVKRDWMAARAWLYGQMFGSAA